MDKGITGLVNLGNTCFINACLQIFSNTIPLNNYLNQGNIVINNHQDSIILKEWDNLRKLMWSENCTISPRRFLQVITLIARKKNNEIFSSLQQNDLPEFFLFMIDCFHNAVSYDIQKIKPRDKSKFKTKCFECLNTYNNGKHSKFIDMFYGIQTTRIFNNDNLLKSEVIEQFSILNLPVTYTNNQSISLLECLETYCKGEELKGDNAWYNDKSKTYENVTKQNVFVVLPDIIIIALNRFDNYSNRCNKDICFSLDMTIDFGHFTINPKKQQLYSLYGVCAHLGSANSGHYLSYIKNANNNWYKYNDECVTKLNNKTINTKTPYVFFFNRII